MDPSPSLGARLATLNAEISTAIGALNGRMEGLTGRVVGSEAAHRALQADARAVLEQLLVQARAEFENQGVSLLTLRSEVQQEALAARQFLGETRLAVEQLYAGAQGEFAPLQQAAQESRQALTDLAQWVSDCERAASPA